MAPVAIRREYYYLHGAPITTGYLIAGDNLPDPLPDPTGGAPYIAWPMPEWMPRQVFIVQAIAGFECLKGKGQAYEVEVWVDPSGKSFFSTDPPGLEANFERDIALIQDYMNPIPREKFSYSPSFVGCPVLWNRDNGDLLVFKIAASTELAWVTIEIQFIVALEGVTDWPIIGPGY